MHDTCVNYPCLQQMDSNSRLILSLDIIKLCTVVLDLTQSTSTIFFDSLLRWIWWVKWTLLDRQNKFKRKQIAFS